MVATNEGGSHAIIHRYTEQKLKLYTVYSYV